MANIRTYRRNLTSERAGLRVLCASSTVLRNAPDSALQSTSAGMGAWPWQPALSHQLVGDGLSFGPSCAFALKHMRPLVLCAGTG